VQLANPRGESIGYASARRNSAGSLSGRASGPATTPRAFLQNSEVDYTKTFSSSEAVLQTGEVWVSMLIYCLPICVSYVYWEYGSPRFRPRPCRRPILISTKNMLISRTGH